MQKTQHRFDVLKPGPILTQYAQYYDTLGEDIYHPKEKGGRTRRLAQFYATYCPTSKVSKITRLKTQPFLQGEFNKLTGHIERPMDSVLPETDMKPYIRWGFEQIDNRWPLKGQEEEWLINTHLIRTHSKESIDGHPAPEGIHRDGVEFVVMGCVDKANITGGISHLYNKKHTDPIFGITLEPGEALVVDDRELMHMATPIHADEGEGYRDTILMGFHYWSREHYRADWKECIYDANHLEHNL